MEAEGYSLKWRICSEDTGHNITAVLVGPWTPPPALYHEPSKPFPVYQAINSPLTPNALSLEDLTSYFFRKITVVTWVSESYSLWREMAASFKLFILFASPKENIDIFFLKLMPLPMFATFPPLKHCSINYSVCWIFQTSSIAPSLDPTDMFKYLLPFKTSK